MRSLVYLLVILAMTATASAAMEPWKDLFDGKSLYGWQQLNGEAKYEIVDNTIVGTTVLNTPNSFLCTQAHYSDFILELEYQVDPKLNSGIQIRSNSYPEYNNGRVHGYQIEIDPSARAWSAGIYDEARRGWLHTLEGNAAAQQAFKQNGWNHYRIEAIGDTLKTWINGVPAAHLVDTMTDNGFIALQVHGIGNKKDREGVSVAWRNIRIIDENVAAHTRPTPLPPHDNFNKLTSNESKGGWTLLWDGKSTEGWRNTKSDGFPKSGWSLKHGTLTVLGKHGGSIITTEKYGNFVLSVDFKMTAGANSGIKYFVNPENAIGLEFQVLDDDRHQDAKLGRKPGIHTVGALYDLIAPVHKTIRPIGEWNNARIVSRNNHVEHWLNGRKVLEFERGSPAYRELVAESKYKKYTAFGELPEGLILLQDHGDQVSFRNIKIKALK